MTPPLLSDPLDAAALWYARLAQGRLSPADGAAFDSWLAEPGHLDAFTRVSETWDRIEPPAEEEELPVASLTGWRRLSRRGVIGGGIVAAMAASLALIILPRERSDSDAMQLQTTFGERRVARLQDGSIVTLDGNSDVLVQETAAERRLMLASGRALFDVRKDKARPFVVDSSGISVTATGTLFSVEHLQDQVQVELYEGGVTVRSLPHRFERAVRPGMRLTIYADGRPAVMAPQRDGRGKAWTNGDVVLIDEPLWVAAQRMNRTSARQIEVDPAVAAFKMSGVFRSGEVDGFVDAVTSLLDVRAEMGGTVIRFEPGRR